VVLHQRKVRVWCVKWIAVCLTLLGLGSGWWATAAEPGPIIPKGKGEQCVADTDFMRRNHMRLLIHQRDATVLEGIRDEPFSLIECVDCHAQTAANGETRRIDAKGQFCQSCHAYAAVKIDCFTCHAAVPDSSSSAALAPPDTASTSALNATAISQLLHTFRHDQASSINSRL